MTPLELARLHQSLPVGAQVVLPASRFVIGAGFTVRDGVATRERTLPDIVAPGMKLLVCGLNPSLYSADKGVNFARPGNRFWPAALEAGVVSRDRDPWHALEVHRVGWTDLVKRATVSASSLSAQEYREGAAQVSALVSALGTEAVCFVGLTGWRVAVSKHAAAGWQPEGFAGVPAYVMPNTSGLNAHTTHAGFVAHLRAALSPP